MHCNHYKFGRTHCVHGLAMGLPRTFNKFVNDIPNSFSRWRYSPGWALASATICLQVSWFFALSLHSFIPIFLRSMDTSSSHLILHFPLRLVAYSFLYSIFIGIAVPCILHSFYMTKLLYSLAFNKPDNVLSLDYGF